MSSPPPPRRSRTEQEPAESSPAASGKAPSLVVAASMGAVEALKDQAGLCRWDYALRSLYHRAAAPRIHALAAALSGSVSVPPASRPPSAAADAARMRKAYHLVCWGPN